MEAKNRLKVLACVDQSRFADYVADYASWAAQRLNTSLELLHVIDRQPETSSASDRSGAIGLDAQENLLSALSDQDELQSKTARERGRIFLNRLRERTLAAGVELVDTRQRHGRLESSLMDLEAEVGLFVLGRRGESAETSQRDLGRNVEQVVRSLHKPILTVTEAFREPRRVLIAFDNTSLSRKAVELVAHNPLLQGLPIQLLMSGKESAGAAKQLEWARKKLHKARFEVQATLIPGDAETVITRSVAELEIDILVMGAYSHSPWRSLIFGSKTSDLLRSAKIPSLLVR